METVLLHVCTDFYYHLHIHYLTSFHHIRHQCTDPSTCTCDLITGRVVWLQGDMLSYWFSPPICKVYILRVKHEEKAGLQGVNFYIRNSSADPVQCWNHNCVYCRTVKRKYRFFFHLFVSPSPSVSIFLPTPVSSLWGVCLCLSSFSFSLSFPVCLSLSATLSLSGRYPLL